jgi:hypothetical protein
VLEGVRRLALRPQRAAPVSGRDGRPVLTALAAPDNAAVLAEVHVLDAQADALQQAQAAAIEQPRQEGVPTRHGGGQPPDCRLGEHGGRPRPAFAAGRGDLALEGRVQDIPVDNHQGVQGLPRGGGRHPALGGQVRENALHLLCPEPVRMGLAAEVTDVAPDPAAIGLLGAVRIAIIAEHLAHLVHQLEAGIRPKFRCIFVLTFHNLAHSITGPGNEPWTTQYLDRKQPNFPYQTMNITVSGKFGQLYQAIWRTTFR